MVRRRFLIHRSGCAVCGKPLLYNIGFKKLQCYYCEEEKATDVACEEGHFVCDACHRIDANELILNTCLKYKGTDPLYFVNTIMEHDAINIHGPEHHFLVPAVLLTVYANKTGKISNLKESLGILRNRMVKIPGGICATHGGCGAILGLGAFVSYITDTTSLSTKAWANVHAVSSNGLIQVSKYGGPRCCKRTTFIAILEGINWLHEYQNIVLDRPQEIVCGFHLRNEECIGEKCLFNKKQ